VRRLHEARGHGLEFACGRPHLPSPGARVLARDVAERPPERAEALPAGRERDLGDRAVGVAQECDRLLDAARQQVAVRRYAERLLELPREVGRRDAADAREPVDGPRLRGGRAHAVLRAEQAAEEGGVLEGRGLVRRRAELLPVGLAADAGGASSHRLSG
jgi:hypothetical protein